MRELLAENFDAWRRRVAACFEAARDRFQEEMDPDALAAFVLTVMEGAVMQSRTYRTLEAYDTSVAMLRAYLDRLLAEPGRGGEAGGGTKR